jgi:quinol monooxygenase YgiN
MANLEEAFMIKHIVAWRLNDEHDKRASAAQIKELLEGLRGQIPGLLHIEVGVNVVIDVNAADVVLYSEFVDLQALKTYQAHPLHQAVVPKVKALTTERRSVDYEI